MEHLAPEHISQKTHYVGGYTLQVLQLVGHECWMDTQERCFTTQVTAICAFLSVVYSYFFDGWQNTT